MISYGPSRVVPEGRNDHISILKYDARVRILDHAECIADRKCVGRSKREEPLLSREPDSSLIGQRRVDRPRMAYGDLVALVVKALGILVSGKVLESVGLGIASEREASK